MPIRRLCTQSLPLWVEYFGHGQGLQFEGANWSGPSRTEEETKRRCKGRPDMPIPMPKKTLLGAQAQKYKFTGKQFCLCASSSSAFWTPFEGWTAT